MDLVGTKRNRNRKKRRHAKKRRRDHLKFEVKTFKRTKLVAECSNISLAKEKLTTSAMQAESFWKNYTIAQEWQKRHSVTWWRSRCFALEYENQVLRDKIRSLHYQLVPPSNKVASRQRYNDKQPEENLEEEHECGPEDEDLEFHVDQDMMKFLEQSIKHKMELKMKKESESLADAQKEKERELIPVQGGAAWMAARNSNAKLLYGDSSATILAMETALQTTIDRHKDKAKPQFWPVIPLRP